MPKKTTTTKAKTTTTPKAATKTATKNDDLASLQFSVQGDPYWAADLNDAGHTVALYGKSKEQVEDRAREILASRQARPGPR
jgi:hypothetical protein